MKAILSIPLVFAFICGPALLDKAIPQDFDFMPALVAGVEFLFSLIN